MYNLQNEQNNTSPFICIILFKSKKNKNRRFEDGLSTQNLHLFGTPLTSSTSHVVYYSRNSIVHALCNVHVSHGNVATPRITLLHTCHGVCVV